MMELTLDEQTGEAGFNTRLEAFLDMMEWRVRMKITFPHLGNVYIAGKAF